MEGRAAAAAAREDKIAAAAQAVAAAEAEADWRPRRDPALRPRVPPRVGKLFSMCLAVLVEYIDDVETLYGMPTMIKVNVPVKPVTFLCRQSETDMILVRSTGQGILQGDSSVGPLKSPHCQLTQLLATSQCLFEAVRRSDLADLLAPITEPQQHWCQPPKQPSACLPCRCQHCKLRIARFTLLAI